MAERSGETAPGASDDGDDFPRHDVVGTARSSPATFSGLRVSAHAWPRPDGDYRSAHWKDYAAFYARALERC